MTHHGIAQSVEKRNPESPENRPRTRGFLQKRLFQTRSSAALLNGFGVLHGRLDNGPEFAGCLLDQWAYLNGVELDFSRPGTTTDNAFIEAL